MKCWRIATSLLWHGLQRFIVGCILFGTYTVHRWVAKELKSIFYWQTYRSCYEEGGELNHRTEYQILNSSGVSSLKWPEHNGIYTFAVTIVARDYRQYSIHVSNIVASYVHVKFSPCSFCHLTAHFTVNVYGASGAAILGYVLLVLTSLIGMGVLIFSYYVYKQRPKPE